MDTMDKLNLQHTEGSADHDLGRKQLGTTHNKVARTICQFHLDSNTLVARQG